MCSFIYDFFITSTRQKSICGNACFYPSAEYGLSAISENARTDQEGAAVNLRRKYGIRKVMNVLRSKAHGL